MRMAKPFTIQEMMSNPSYNKAKGAKYEIDVMKLFRSLGHLAERLRLAGKDDEGDLVCVVAGQTYILELKNRKTINLSEFWSEAQVEALNYAKARGIGEVPLHYVLVKRRNAGIEKSWVIQDLEQWLKEKKMPVPQGDITTTAGFKLEQEEVEEVAPVEEVKEEE